MKRLKTIALWALQILLAFLFFQVGRMKFTVPRWEQTFRETGYPDHFYQVVGGIELLGGLSLLIPQAAGYGAPAVMVIMVGAFVHHLRRAEWANAPVPVVLFLLLAIVAYARRPSFLRNLHGSSKRVPVP